MTEPGTHSTQQHYPPVYFWRMILIFELIIVIAAATI